MKQLLGSKLASGVIRRSCSNHYNRLWRQWILSAKKCFGCPLNHLVIAVMTSASEWHYCPFSFLWGSKQIKDTWRQIRAVGWLWRASHLVHAHASCTRFTKWGQVTHPTESHNMIACRITYSWLVYAAYLMCTLLWMALMFTSGPLKSISWNPSLLKKKCQHNLTSRIMWLELFLFWWLRMFPLCTGCFAA